MKDVFLEVLTDQSIANNFDYYLNKFPIEKSLKGNLIFGTEEIFCDCLAELERQLNDTLAQYWVCKTPDLMKQNAEILGLITLLNKANIKKQAAVKIAQSIQIN